jgi:tetratricopeptide (TPR) repeat protein
VDLGAMFERTWGGIRGKTRPAAAATLFRRADQYRNEGRYEEAAALVARGLEQDPDSSVGHLLWGYLQAARRDMGPAKLAFQRVLALDRYHPRALLGLARLAIEEGDLRGAQNLLDQALQFYPDFPEAQALREMVASGSNIADPVSAVPSAVIPPTALHEELTGTARDVVVARSDGALVHVVQISEERAKAIAQHLAQVVRIASATLSHAGLAPLRHGVIESDSGATFVLNEGRLILTATEDCGVDPSAGLANVGRLSRALGAGTGA